MLYVNVQVLGNMFKLGISTPHLKNPNNMRITSWLQKSDFMWEAELWIQILDLTINVLIIW